MILSSGISRGGMAAGLWVLMAGAACLGADEVSDKALRQLAQKAVALEIQLQVVSSSSVADEADEADEAEGDAADTADEADGADGADGVEGDEVLWNRQTRKLTIPGRGVAVRMEGQSLRLLAKITPYNQGEGKVLLVIQGQVWAQDPESRRVRYHSTMKSLSLQYEETAYFFPLGTTSLRRTGQEASGEGEKPSEGEAGLRMTLRVVPYGSLSRGSADDGSADDGSADDGSADDGSADDGSADDGSADDGSDS